MAAKTFDLSSVTADPVETPVSNRPGRTPTPIPENISEMVEKSYEAEQTFSVTLPTAEDAENFTRLLRICVKRHDPPVTLRVFRAWDEEAKVYVFAIINKIRRTRKPKEEETPKPKARSRRRR